MPVVPMTTAVLFIEAIFKFGLHDFLQKMISLFADLSDQIEIDYRFYE